MFAKISKTAFGALALGVAMASMSPVAALADEPAAHLSYSASALSTPQGAHRLYGRLYAAANEACGTSDSDTDVIMRGPGPCVRDALARAVRQLNSAQLSAVFIEKYGVDVARSLDISSEVRTASN
jgi:UrcA family protein